VVYGDSAYGAGAHLAWLHRQQLTPIVKAQLSSAPGGRFAKDQFRIDLVAGMVTCPARVTTPILPASRGGGRARFGAACGVCPLRNACTNSVRGRVVTVHPHEAELAAARVRQGDPACWPTTELPGPRWTQARSPAAPTPRRSACLGARADARGPGLQAVGRGGQPGPLRDPWAALNGQWLAGPVGLASNWTSGCRRTAQHAELLRRVRENRPPRVESGLRPRVRWPCRPGVCRRVAQTAGSGPHDDGRRA